MTTVAPTYQDYFVAGRGEAANRRPDLTFDEGDIAEFDMAAGAAMADHLTGYTSQRVRATFLDGAFNDDLTDLADDRYNIQRQIAVPAAGVTTWTRSGGLLAGTVPFGTVVATSKDNAGNEVQYVTDNDTGWAAAQASQDVAVTAVIAGVSGNAGIGKVNRVVTTGLFDTFTVTNAARMAGGADAELDAALRDRCRNFTQTLRRGTLAALEFGAKEVAGIATAVAVEPGDGTVNVYVADASGNSSPTMVTDAAAEGENWRCAGTIVNYYGGVLYPLTGIDIALTVRAGVNIAALVQDIKKAIVARVAKLKGGEACSPDLIKAAAMSVDPDGILAVAVNSPAATVVPTPDQIIRTTTSDITVG